MKIYLAHPITGLSFNKVEEYYVKKYDDLTRFGYTVFFPMVAKRYLSDEKEMKAESYDNYPLSTNHAIIERDRWMVLQSDVIYVDFCFTKRVSIGCCMELGWGHDHAKHTIISMEKNNVHSHAFVIEAADVIFPTEEEATKYLKKLIQRRI